LKAVHAQTHPVHLAHPFTRADAPAASSLAAKAAGEDEDGT